MGKRRQKKARPAHEITRIWDWDRDDRMEGLDVVWSWSCACGKGGHELPTREAARDAAVAHVEGAK